MWPIAGPVELPGREAGHKNSGAPEAAPISGISVLVEREMHAWTSAVIMYSPITVVYSSALPSAHVRGGLPRVVGTLQSNREPGRAAMQLQSARCAAGPTCCTWCMAGEACSTSLTELT